MPPLPAKERSIFQMSDRLLESGPPIRGTVTVALAIAALGLGGFGVWAATAPLASGAIASGMVRVDSNKKTVQHLEGGLIREILVREGDRVRAGQVLVRLQALAVEADREVLQNQLFTAMAEEARLTAERSGAGRIVFPSELLAQQHQLSIASLIGTQEQILRSQQAALEGEMAVHSRRIEQQRASIEALTRQMSSTERQTRLLLEELATAEELLAKGYERKPRVLGLQRNVAQLEAELSGLNGRMLAAKETVAESQAQIESLRRQRDNAVSADLEKARAKRAEVEEQLRKTSDKLARIDVVAPQSGIVLGMKYFAPGAVVPSGGVILDIVPEADSLVMYVRVSPLDIDVVREGLAAEVRLVAYKQRNVPTLTGRVTQVSADAVADEKSPTASFYLTRVEVSPAELAKVPDVKLYPGMPVEAVILTGERTLLDYLVRPVLDSFAHAFKEQ